MRDTISKDFAEIAFLIIPSKGPWLIALAWKKVLI